MKSFQDYLSLKEVSGTALARNIVGTDTGSNVSLNTVEAETFHKFLQAIETILSDSSKASTFVSRVKNLLDDQELDLDISILRRAAQKMNKEANGQSGLGDATGSDKITSNSTDRIASNF